MIAPRGSGHERSIEGIAKGEYQAAAVSADMLARAEATGVIAKNQYRSIYKSESFPSAALGYVYFEGQTGRRTAAGLLTRDEARRIAANIAKLIDA